MGYGPRYRRAKRRRFEGKTDYRKRLKLLKSRKLRIVIRASSNHTRVQFVESKKGGDRILVSAFSKELAKTFGYKANTGNQPSAYLTGYLAGLRAKKNNINEGILDLGMFYHRNRVLAAFKGVLKAGIEIPYREEFFPEDLEENINGSKIENYAKMVKQNEPEKYEILFSGYIKKNKIDPMKLSQLISTTLKKIENSA
jgi:large subunit ribosomal protein L18